MRACRNAPAFHSPHGMENLPISMVDNAVTPRLYTPHNGAPPRFRRDGAPAKLLTIGVTRRRFRSAAWSFGRLSGRTRERGSPRSPGCLTSESEERETWTAESLRAVSHQREIVVRRGRTRLRRYTFLGTTLVGCVSNHADDYMLDLVKMNVAARKRRYAQNV